MAPECGPISQAERRKVRRKVPGKNFIKNWFKFLSGTKWPIKFPYKLAFCVWGALLYALIMLLTVLWQYPKAIDKTPLIFLSGVGLGSAFLWWITLPFAVAANENRWHPGGVVTSLSYILWHCMVAISFAWICGTDQITSAGANRIVYIVIDLFFILAIVVICCCNASQTIIVLAETIREDNRKEIRQAIRAFQQFKYKMFGTTINNYVAVVSAKPVIYFIFLIVSIMIIGFNTYVVLTTGNNNANAAISWVFLLRNILALFLVTSLVLWYQSAFNFIKREVYKP